MRHPPIDMRPLPSHSRPDSRGSMYRLSRCPSESVLAGQNNVFVINQYAAPDEQMHQFRQWEDAFHSAQTLLDPDIPRVFVFYPGVYTIPDGTVLEGSWMLVSPTRGQATLRGTTLHIRESSTSGSHTLFQDLALDLHLRYELESTADTSVHTIDSVVCSETAQIEVVSSDDTLSNNSGNSLSARLLLVGVQTIEPAVVDDSTIPPSPVMIRIFTDRPLHQISLTACDLQRNGSILDISGNQGRIDIHNCNLSDIYSFGSGYVVSLAGEWESISLENTNILSVNGSGVFLNGDVDSTTNNITIRNVSVGVYKTSLRCAYPGAIRINDSIFSCQSPSLALVMDHGINGAWIRNVTISGFSYPPFDPTEGLVQIRHFTQGTIFWDNIHINDSGLGNAVVLIDLQTEITNMSIVSLGNGFYIDDCAVVLLTNCSVQVNDTAIQLTSSTNQYAAVECTGGSFGGLRFCTIPKQLLPSNFQLNLRGMRTQFSGTLYQVEAEQSTVTLTSDSALNSNQTTLADVESPTSTMYLNLNNTSNLGSTATRGNVVM